MHINDNTDKDRAKRDCERLTEFMKLSEGCKNKQGGHYYEFKISDGTLLDIGAIYINIDVDGSAKGKNSAGYDKFSFEITENSGIKPKGYDINFKDLLDEVSTRRGYAATWIINYDNADYLKLDGRGKCPNGTTPTETNPRCK